MPTQGDKPQKPIPLGSQCEAKIAKLDLPFQIRSTPSGVRKDAFEINIATSSHYRNRHDALERRNSLKPQAPKALKRTMWRRTDRNRYTMRRFVELQLVTKRIQTKSPAAFLRKWLNLTSTLALSTILLASMTSMGWTQGQPDISKAGNKKVAEIMRTFGGRGVMADGSAPTTAQEAIREFQVGEGLEIHLMASEPTVEQPLFISWDSRGRMWVVQYRQYQFPAGLKVVRYDQHLRAVFDKVPDPPPHGTPGVDKITVHEDTDGDGYFDQSKDVITNLNIATSVQVGNGSIWVLNPPYLLRYPDEDRDDIPDGDPEVHLSGFGLQDTHSVANSLLWGPDGWLYGANGSTTVGDVSSSVTKGVRFQGQCIWRYHPDSHEFEIFAEGGGNTFSLDIDSKGRVFSGTNGGNTRGWYYPQGSYSAKNWGKHGPLTNPYAFGFFNPMDFEGDGRRFAQAFCIYEGGLLPDLYRESIVAPNSLHNLVWNSERIPNGSTYRTVDQANLITSKDRWFRPVYGGVGPDGAIYIADWYDSRLSHVSPTDDWHKESGRIYRIAPQGSTPIYTEGDLETKSNKELLSLFDHPNKWIRQRSMMTLGWRKDKNAIPQLKQLVKQGSLESLWALNLMGEFSSSDAAIWLEHRDPHIRRWVVRLAGDHREPISGLARLATVEQDIQVRSQLASTAKRLEAGVGLSIIEGLIQNDQDAQDPHLPMLIWWAIESHCDHWESVQAFLSQHKVWESRIFTNTVASRLMQRYAASAKPDDLQHCAWILEQAFTPEHRKQLTLGMSRAFEGRTMPELPASLTRSIRDHADQLGNSATILGIRQRDEETTSKAIKTLVDRGADLGLKIEIAKTFGEIRTPQAVPTLLSLGTGRGTSEPALQRVALQSLASYNNDSIPTTLLPTFGSSISAEHGLRSTACRTLASRPQWAKKLIEEVNAWRLLPSQIPADVQQQLRSYPDEAMQNQLDDLFGKTIHADSDQRQEYTRITNILATGTGTAEKGRQLFAKHCGNCHQLFGEGNKIGPPLDGYERGNLDFWLNAIIAPSMEIREGFQSYLLLTDDGRSVTGMIADQDSKTVTLRNAENQITVLSRDQIESLQALPTSLMPNNLLGEISDQDIRDLFTYLSLGTQR
jgi:putative heme-binding domain-containing protein